jgi:demethylmenaquinone methyltransferase/2-methoxy-6-polyprenyl-1,4-benzoquinol methylase
MNTPPNSAPPPPPGHGRQPAYGERARSYERDTAAFQPYRRAVVEALPLRSGHVVLDVGCGTGLCCGLLRDKVGPGGGVVGIEESPEMAAVAREHMPRSGRPPTPPCSAPCTTSCSPRTRCETS